VKITMTAEISGLRDGKPWPMRGESISVPDDEAEALIGNRLAKKYEKDDEVAPEPIVGPEVEVTELPAPETATPPAPKKTARKAPAKKAAAKKAAPKSGS
jgi:hypothetical protein